MVDRIRTVNDDSANDNNFRFNPNNGQQVDTDTGTPGVQPDGDLAFAAGDANAGDTPVVGGVAYTNNLDGATTTTLYDIETGNDVLTTQDPPNSGTLNTVGSLGVPTTATVGFDIETGTGVPYAALQPSAGAQSTFYRLDQMTGAATANGAIGPAGSAPLDAVSLIPVPIARFANAATSVSEDGGTATVSILREGPLNQTATVNYATEIASGDNAVSGSDFTATNGTLTFAPGDAEESFEVPIIDNDNDNADKTFTVRLSGPSPSLNLRMPPTSQVRIVDEDDSQAPLVALVDVKTSDLQKVLRKKAAEVPLQLQQGV